MAVPKRVNGVGILGISLNWEYVQSNRDVVRRVLTALEDKQVLWFEYNREDPEPCRLSAQKIRDLMNLEIPNVKHGGSLEASFKRIRAAARDFVRAAGDHSEIFLHDLPFFWACLHAMRISIGEETVAMAAEFKIDLEEGFLRSLPVDDLTWMPGFAEE